MRFIDRVKIFVESGAGGDGCVSFRREKFVPRGGPDGGDGGRGGDVFIRTDPQLSTLIDYRYKREYRAGTGAHGRGAKMTGKDGDPVVLRVPPGTQIMDVSTGELLADLTEGEYIPAKGGRGGADVGIVGLPNAGKSTLISRISAARPKVADYPFTTLVPNLGVVRVDDERSFVVADVPGLVEGAHQGVGLGHQFLRHVERTSVILHLVGLAPGDGDPVEAYRTIRQELGQYADDLARKDSIVALSKTDVVSQEERESILAKFQEDTGIIPMLISAAVGEGLTPLVGKLSTMIEKLKEKDDD